MKAALSVLAVVGLSLPLASNAATLSATGTVAHSCTIDDATGIPLSATDATKLEGSTSLNVAQNGSTLWTLTQVSDDTPSGEDVSSEFTINNFFGVGNLLVNSGDTDTIAVGGALSASPTLLVKVSDTGGSALRAGTYTTTATLTCVAN